MLNEHFTPWYKPVTRRGQSGCSTQKANTRETSVGGKGNFALLERPATWEDGALMS